MAFELDLTTVAAPDAVLGTIRAEAGQWQAAMVPDEVTGLRALGVEVRIDGYRFELALKDLHRDPPTAAYVLRGEVTPLATGGSRVRTKSSFRGYERIGFALVAALALWLMLRGQPIAGLMLFVANGGIGAYRVLSHAVLAREWAAGVQHLAERLELALRSADQQVARDAS